MSRSLKLRGRFRQPAIFVSMLSGLFAALFGFLCAPAIAQSGTSQPAPAPSSYPARPVTLVVPFGAGGSADVYARVLAQRLSQDTGQPFVVENRPGAGAVIGTLSVAKAAPDGYTLLVMSNTQTVNESLLKKKPYELLRDFAPITPINETALVLVARPGLAVTTITDLIRLARAEPGKLSYASSGTGTPYHMAGELFKSRAGVDVLHVPYKSSGGARTDVLGGQVDMMFDAVSTMADLIGAGKVRALATTGAARASVLPDVPTLAEAGLTDYTATLWLGLLAPKGTPVAIIDQLNRRIGAIVDDPEVRANWARSGVTPLKMTPDEFGRFLVQDIDKWGRLAASASITVEQ